MKNTLLVGGAVVLLVVVGGGWLVGSGTPQSNDPEVVSANGLHWHPTLAIYVKGVRQEIPANIGVGTHYAGQPTYDSRMRMSAIHTHDDTPIIHLEFPGIVREDDLRLGNFFLIWGKDMKSFGSNRRPSDERGSTEASRPNVRMMVNGKENVEFEKYIMHDGDRIELQYD